MQDKDYALSEVPSSARKSLSSLIWVLCGFTFFTATMFAGGGVGAALPLSDVISVMAIGYGLLATYAILIGLISYKTGLNTVLLSRYSFGDKGSKIVDFLLGFTQIGWYAWGTAVIAKVLIAMTPDALGFTIPDSMLYPMMVFFGFAFSYTAYKGYRGLALLSIVSVPLMLLFVGVSLYTATIDANAKGGIASLMPGTGNMTWDIAITMAFGTFASGATQVSNWTRFASSSKNVIVAVLFAFFFGNALMFFTGAFGASVYGKPDVVDVLLLQGFPLMALLMLFLNLWTTQDNASYNFAVAGCNFVRSDNRQKMTIVGAVIGTVLALMGADVFLFGWLIMLGTFIPPVGGIIMADYVARSGSYAKLASAKNADLCAVGLTAYVVGSACAYYSPMLSPLVGIAVSFIVYVGLYKIKK
ncbi:MAG: cytosine permease [Alphaproteobacteria bacterium]